MIYTKKLEEFVDSFCTKHQLLNPQKPILLSISGGVDSIVLFHVFYRLGKKFEVIHFNHGTRRSNKLEENLITNLCKQKNIKLHVHHLKLNLNTANFEHVARSHRQKIYSLYLKDNYQIVCAHHLNDAFEWHLMQKFKQSSLEKNLGMPVKNRGVVRPFFCLSKNHIYRYAKKLNLSWIEDESNLNNKFERNFIRNIVVQQIHKKYPAYLKHFVIQQNSLLNIYRGKGDQHFTIVEHVCGGYVFRAENLHLHRDQILKLIERLSNKERGKLSKTLEQLLQGQQTFLDDPKKHVFYGPFKFSGGVSAILYSSSIYFYTQQEESKWNQVDNEYYKNHNTAQITYGLLNQSSINCFPNISLNKFGKTKLIFPLLPKFITKLKKSDIPYSYNV